MLLLSLHSFHWQEGTQPHVHLLSVYFLPGMKYVMISVLGWLIVR